MTIEAIPFPTGSSQISPAAGGTGSTSAVNAQADWASRVMRAYRVSLADVHRRVAPLRG